MAAKRISRAFKDISLSFEPHPVTKDLPVLKNERAISRAVRNLVQTRFNERFFQPRLGSSAGNSLFEFLDFASAGVLEDEIKDLIQTYEPRVNNVDVLVSPRPEVNRFDATIFFDIVGLAVPQQQVQFILEATR